MANHNDKEKLFCCQFWGGAVCSIKKREEMGESSLPVHTSLGLWKTYPAQMTAGIGLDTGNAKERKIHEWSIALFIVAALGHSTGHIFALLD